MTGSAEQGRQHTSKVPVGMVTTCALAALAMAFTAPPSHTPEANLYYGMAARAARGDLAATLDPRTGPLLSWLIAPLYLLGVELATAYRAVSFGVFVLLLEGVRRLTRQVRLSPPLQSLVVLITGVQLLWFSVTLISADLLTAACLTWAVLGVTGSPVERRPLRAGVLGALTYYASPLHFPVFLGVAMAAGLLRLGLNRGARARALLELALSAGVAALLMWPWFSLCRGDLVGQSAARSIVTETSVALTGPPSLRPAPIPPPPAGALLPDGWGPPDGRPWLDRVTGTLVRLVAVFTPHLFGPPAMAVWLCTLIPSAFLAGIGRYGAGVALPAWGVLLHAILFLPQETLLTGQYLPALAFAHIVVFAAWGRGIERVAARGAHARPLALGIAGVLVISMALVSLRAINRNWSARSLDREFVSFVREIPALQGPPRRLSGPAFNWVPGYVAWAIGGEYAHSLWPGSDADTEAVMGKLKEWEVAQVIWIGAPYPPLEGRAGVHRRGPFTWRGIEVWIYDLDPRDAAR